MAGAARAGHSEAPVNVCLDSRFSDFEEARDDKRKKIKISFYFCLKSSRLKIRFKSARLKIEIVSVTVSSSGFLLGGLDSNIDRK